jgi:hypothetical protein
MVWSRPSGKREQYHNTTKGAILRKTGWRLMTLPRALPLSLVSADDSELAGKAGVTSPSEDAAYLRGFRFVISSFQMMLTASTSPEEEAACEQLQAQVTNLGFRV